MKNNQTGVYQDASRGPWKRRSQIIINIVCALYQRNGGHIYYNQHMYPPVYPYQFLFCPSCCAQHGSYYGSIPDVVKFLIFEQLEQYRHDNKEGNTT